MKSWEKYLRKQLTSIDMRDGQLKSWIIECLVEGRRCTYPNDRAYIFSQRENKTERKRGKKTGRFTTATSF